MAKITFLDASGDAREVDINSGFSLMEGAIWNDIEGIIAECGGACSCATCHVLVDPSWMERVGPPNPAESEMIGELEHGGPTSRLSCQVKVSDELDGLVVHVPTGQGFA